MLQQYSLLRLLLLGLVTAFGFIVVYIPLMSLLFDKRIGPIYFPIVGFSVYVAYRLAKFLDKHLPRPKQGQKLTSEDPE